ncbi:hypothetical protein ABEO98_21570 [Brevibacillus parabrevis]|uniref:hypothetical protein n=1 Tax=Brevibacillus parabrevis TaxID=54914 RepID=UPI002E207437|nr:hypothetical protein [Brevibacillus parabrevis]
MNYATMPGQEARLITHKTVELPNGYAIAMKREKISNVGRSIFRQIADEQVVIEIVDRDGRVTKRLPIPASVSEEIAHFIHQ